MQRTILVAIVLSITPHSGLSQEADMESLTAEARPEIQEQINKVYSFYRIATLDDLKNPGEVLEEMQRLGDTIEDKGEIVKQLAIFVATTESEEDLHSMVAGDVLERLRLPASIPIRVLAPYLDAENEKVRDFAHGWFHNHDSYDRIHGRPPLGSVNYYDYAMYVRNRLAKSEKIPAGFIKYIYEKHPGKALLVFAYATQHRDVFARLQAIHRRLEGGWQEEEPVERDETHQHGKKGRHASEMQHRDIELAGRIVSDAIWLNKNGFRERFEAALPEANAELAKLAKADWWSRLYVVYIMRQNLVVRQDHILRQLAKDENELVREAARSGRGQ